MQEGVNNEDDDQKETDNEDEVLITNFIKENGKETNWDNFDKVIEGCPYDTSTIDMKEGVNNEEDHEK